MPFVWLETFFQHPNVQRLREALTKSVSRPIWWTIGSESPKSLDYAAARRTCTFIRTSAGRRECQARFLQGLQKSRRTQAPYRYTCPIQRRTLCLPLKQGDRVHGYLAVCNSEKEFGPREVQLAGLTADTALQEVEKSMELKNLSETIQPRCVALSTVHTVHRLISSTLNLTELLPRVARLCCQVLRGEFCTIWLVDREKKLLLPKAVINIKKNKEGSAPAMRFGKGFIGRAAVDCKSRLMDRTMIVPLVEEECLGVILIRRAKNAQPFGTLDQEVLTTFSEQAVVAIRNAQMYEKQERVAWGTVQSLSAILDGMDVRSPRTGSTRRQLMADVALALAERMGLRDSLQRPLQYAALLHDAGRIGIPAEIIRKPTKLNSLEFAMVKERSVKGARALEPLEILEPAIPIIMHQHERFDGTGYPKGLKGEAIPLGARILCVANAFEAMVSERPYRKSVSIAEAGKEIASHGGTQFDPKVVKVFLALVKDGALARIVQKNSIKEHAS